MPKKPIFCIRCSNGPPSMGQLAGVYFGKLGIEFSDSGASDGDWSVD